MDSQQDGASHNTRPSEPSRQEKEAIGSNVPHVSVLLIPAPDQLETPTRMTIENIPLSATIGEVRQRAQGMIASQPDAGRLRLIHSGRLLSRDDQTLGQLVSAETIQANRTIAIHLILRPLPGMARPQSVPRAGSPANAGVMPGHIHHVQAHNAGQNPTAPLLQPAPIHTFPPRPSSTPAMAGAQGPYAAPVHQQAAGGFASHGIPNAQQAQFMQQLQQQHLNMMQAMLRQGPMQPPLNPGAGHQGHQMTLPDFQRLYNQHAQARQAQTAAPSGRTTPQGFLQPARVTGAGLQHNAADTSSNAESFSQHQFPNMHRNGQQGNPGSGSANAPRLQLSNHSLQTTLIPSFASSTIPNMLSSEHDTVFLLSSPAGHEAILLGPRSSHNSFGAQSRSNSTGPRADRAGQLAPAAALAQQQDNNAANLPGGAAAQGQPLQLRDLMALLMPLGGHVWLVVRLVVVVVLLTLNTSWTRTLVIWLVAFIIYLAQTDVLNPVQQAAEQAWHPIRRHIEELVRDVEVQQLAGAEGNPDSAEAAERLLRRQREQSLLRRIERSVALFVASFVPGVGEAQVAAREAAERQRREELERREREAAERVRQQQEATEADSNEPRAEISGQHEQGSSIAVPNEARQANAESIRHRQPRVEDADE